MTLSATISIQMTLNPNVSTTYVANMAVNGVEIEGSDMVLTTDADHSRASASFTVQRIVNPQDRFTMIISNEDNTDPCRWIQGSVNLAELIS